MENPHVKYLPLSYGSGFFLKRIHYYSFIAKQEVKNVYLNGFSAKKSKIPNSLKFKCTSMSSITQKINQKFHPPF
jgi:hypothetical protein